MNFQRKISSNINDRLMHFYEKFSATYNKKSIIKRTEYRRGVRVDGERVDGDEQQDENRQRQYVPVQSRKWIHYTHLNA